MSVNMIGQLTYEEFNNNLKKYEKMITKLVIYYKRAFSSKGQINYADLLDAAHYGAFLGTLKFDKERGYKWATFVLHYVRSEIQKYVRDTIYGGLTEIPKVDNRKRLVVISNLLCNNSESSSDKFDSYMENNILRKKNKKEEKYRHSDQDTKLLKLIKSEIIATQETKDILIEYLFSDTPRKVLAEKYNIKVSALNARITKCIYKISKSPRFTAYIRESTR